MENHITIVYDNLLPPENFGIKGLKEAWGFSAFITIEGAKILFDCGWKAPILLNNLEKLGIKKDDFDYIVISHQHNDHMGALEAILEYNKGCNLYIPAHFTDDYTAKLKIFTDNIYKMTQDSGPKEISKGVFVTGETSASKKAIFEQAIGINYNEHKILISGCMHPGFKPLWDLVQRKFTPTELMGGVHNFKDPDLLVNLGVKKVYLGHCTSHFDAFEKHPEIHAEKLYVGFKLML